MCRQPALEVRLSSGLGSYPCKIEEYPMTPLPIPPQPSSPPFFSLKPKSGEAMSYWPLPSPHWLRAQPGHGSSLQA